MSGRKLSLKYTFVGIVVLLTVISVVAIAWQQHAAAAHAFERAMLGMDPGDAAPLRKEFNASIARSMTTTVVMGAVLAALAGAVAFLVARLVTGTMSVLVEQSQRVRQLRLERNNDHRPFFGETAEVFRAFDDMKVGLSAFRKYVPSELIRGMLDWQVEPQLGGEVRDLTVFFSDIYDFTPMTERMEANRVAQALGEYLSAVCRPINDRGGTVDKYIGDSVMAFWNAPEFVPNHAAAACAAALDCLRAIDKMQIAHPELPEFRTRIGLHTASVIVGNFGSNERFNYSAMGDGVNLASRLEGLNKVFGTKVIISDATFRQAKSKVETRRLGVVSVVGRREPVTVHELIGETGQVSDEALKLAATYEQGLTFYLARLWPEAIRQFEAVLNQNPNDKAAARMLQTCIELAQHEPSERWTGELTMTSK
jgi:adenylate cyclase